MLSSSSLIFFNWIFNNPVRESNFNIVCIYVACIVTVSSIWTFMCYLTRTLKLHMRHIITCWQDLITMNPTNLLCYMAMFGYYTVMNMDPQNQFQTLPQYCWCNYYKKHPLHMHRRTLSCMYCIYISAMLITDFHNFTNARNLL